MAVASGTVLQTLQGDSQSVMSVAFSPDNSKLASGSDEGMLQLWDVTNGECLHTIQGHFETV